MRFQNFRFLLKGRAVPVTRCRPLAVTAKQAANSPEEVAFPDFIPQRLTSERKSKMWCVHPAMCVRGTHSLW